VIKSIELVEELKSIATKSLIIPMNFVSMRGSSIDFKETFTVKKMTREHWQLLGECLDHDLKVLPQLLRIRDMQERGSIRWRLLRIAAKLGSNDLKKYVGALRRGDSPIVGSISDLSLFSVLSYVGVLRRGDSPRERREESTWLAPQIPDLNGV